MSSTISLPSALIIVKEETPDATIRATCRLTTGDMCEPMDEDTWRIVETGQVLHRIDPLYQPAQRTHRDLPLVAARAVRLPRSPPNRRSIAPRDYSPAISKRNALSGVPYFTQYTGRPLR